MLDSRIVTVFSKACFSCESTRVPTAGIRTNRSCPYGLSFLSPNRLLGDRFPVACIAPNEPSGSSIGSCAISAMTQIFSAEIKWTKKPCSICVGWSGQPISPLTAGLSKTSKRLRLQRSGKNFPAKPSVGNNSKGAAMIFSHTQISQYLRCPRSYRYRYLDGRREKETRAAMAFGRCFERALAAYFSGQDSSAVLFKEWGAFRDTPFEYKKGESWDRLVHQGVHLLERFAQDDRVKIHQPEQDLQVKMNRSLPGGNEFVSYLDAVGELDGTKCLIDWKTTTSRYPEEPEGL